MKKYFVCGGVTILTLFIGVWYLINDTSQNDIHSPMKSEIILQKNQGVTIQRTQDNVVSSESSILRSPFSMQQFEAEKENISFDKELTWQDFDLATRLSEEDKRFSSLPKEKKNQLRQLGYFVPSSYLKIELPDLLIMSRKGDIQAMALAGESIALNSLKARAEAQSDTLNQTEVKQAQQLLEQSVANGNMRAANILSQYSLEQNDEVGARAWLLLAKQAGDLRAEEALRGNFAPPNEQMEIDNGAKARLVQLVNQINSLRIIK